MIYFAIAIIIAVMVAYFFLGWRKGFIKSSWWGINYILTGLFVTLILSCIPDIESAVLNFAIRLILCTGIALFVFLILRFAKTKVKILADGGQAIIGVPDTPAIEEPFAIHGDFEPVKPKEISTKYVFANKLIGGINGAINGFSIAFITLLVLFSSLECFRIDSIVTSFSYIYQSSFWADLKPFILDFLIIGAFITCITLVGFRTGLCEKFWKAFHILMIVGAFVLAYALVINVGFFSNLADTFATWLKDSIGFLNDTESAIDFLKSFMGFITATDVAGLIANFLFIILFIAFFILIAEIINKSAKNAFAKVRQNSFFYVLDGVLGGVAAYALLLALCLLIGGILFTFNGSESLEAFNEYVLNAEVASIFYSKNPFNLILF